MFVFSADFSGQNEIWRATVTKSGDLVNFIQLTRGHAGQPSTHPRVSTDGNSPKATGRTDGLWAVDTEGEARATSKLFFRVPVGAELCGPLFSPDDTTVFVAVQHPGDGGEGWEGFGRVSYYEDLSTRWPDFRPDMPVRPSVVAITRQGGGRIAG